MDRKEVRALQWTGHSLIILDQRLLPEKTVYNEHEQVDGVIDAIKTMRVRGAPAIGIAAAYAVVLSAMQHFSESEKQWKDKVVEDIQSIARSRPTAVNLFWALDLMRQALFKQAGNLITELTVLAEKIHQQDRQANMRMGELGADLLGGVNAVMTHCNAGALATGGYGTALGVVRSAFKRGLKTIYAGETRPWLQGARLTAWELAQENIPVTVIADSAAAWLMQSGKLQWIIVGADRIAANGDVANKIGTYSLAVIARHHQVKMMVVAPVSSIDFAMESGENIQIEQRSQDELLPRCYLDESSGVGAWNPVFDVTPAHLIDVIVTELGVVHKPTLKGIRSLKNEFNEKGE